MPIVRNLTGPFPFVWEHDPALDKDKPGYSWQEYIKAGDLKHLRVKEGEELAVFQIRPLPRVVFLRVFRMPDRLDQVNEAVAYGLVSVVGFYVGKEPVSVQHKTDGHGTERVTDECLDKLFDPTLWAHLGGAIIERSQIHPL